MVTSQVYQHIQYEDLPKDSVQFVFMYRKKSLCAFPGDCAHIRDVP